NHSSARNTFCERGARVRNAGLMSPSAAAILPSRERASTRTVRVLSVAFESANPWNAPSGTGIELETLTAASEGGGGRGTALLAEKGSSLGVKPEDKSIVAVPLYIREQTGRPSASEMVAEKITLPVWMISPE